MDTRLALGKAPTILYRFPLSHFCFVADWALGHHGISYTSENLSPGLHYLRTLGVWRLPDSTLPVLRTNGRWIQGSNHIIDYLDTQNPSHSLTPQNQDLAKEVMALEQWAAENIGVMVRRLFYGLVIDDSDTVLNILMDSRNPLWRGAYQAFFFPFIREGMKWKMRVDPEGIKEADQKLHQALEYLSKRIRNNKALYLVGETFTRADLAVAAFLTPLLFRPEGYIFPGGHPPPILGQLIEKFQNDEILTWGTEVYQKHWKPEWQSPITKP